MAGLEDVLRAITRTGADPDWGVIGPNIVPLLPRRRRLPAGADCLNVLLPPGIMTSFGIDTGPAVMYVGEEALDRWSIDAGQLTARALANVRLRTERARPRDVTRDSIEGIPIRVFQSGEGVASALLLVPDELIRLFGNAPQRIIVPMRDLIVSMGIEAEPGLAVWLNEELASLDPNGLAVEPFCFDGTELRLDPAGRQPYSGGGLIHGIG